MEFKRISAQNIQLGMNIILIKKEQTTIKYGVDWFDTKHKKKHFEGNRKHL